MNDEKKDEKKVYKPSGIEGEAVVIPIPVEDDVYYQHHVTILDGGQFVFSTCCHPSGLIKANEASYVGLYWNEATRCLTIAFDDKLEDQLEQLHVMRLGRTSKLDKETGKDIYSLRVGNKKLLDHIGLLPKPKWKYKFIEPADSDFRNQEILVDLTKKHIKLNFMHKEQEPTEGAIKDGKIKKWLGEWVKNGDEFKRKMVESDDPAWYDWHEEFWRKARTHQMDDGSIAITALMESYNKAPDEV